jgi:N-acetylglucosamine-6-phosphate deacetylase
MKRTIAAKNLATAAGLLKDPLITVDGGQIVGVSSRSSEAVDQVDHDFADCTLTPGFLDIHFHGAVGHDVMESDMEALETIARYLARAGVTQFLPTTVTAPLEATLHALERMAQFIEAESSAEAAQATGIHIEGPFLSHGKRGMHPAEYLLPPSPELLNRFWEASRGHLKLMTIAPEMPGALETIAHAVSVGIRCSIGHSAATRAQSLAGIEAGAVSATHTFNAMRSYDHREPGILGVVLDRTDLYADIICDGLHVSPEAVRLWFKAKGPERAILITDCLPAAGMPDGRYKVGQTVVHVAGATCTTEEGVLAGSVMSLDRAVDNLQAMTGAGLPVASRLASINPAAMLGLQETFAPGSAADFNIYDGHGKRLGTILRGLIL